MRRISRRGRRGAALLEAIVALAVLTAAAVPVVSLAAESLRAIDRARNRERELRAANAFFEAVALWSRADLDRHLGDRRQGHWVMRVDRPSPGLYTVSLADSGTHALLLRTSLYRPD